MKGRFLLIVILSLMLASFTPATVVAQSFRHTLGGSVWFAAGSATVGAGPTSTWSSTVWGLVYEGVSVTSPWGVQLRYETGSNESLWSADVSFSTPVPNMSLGVFAGYGSMTIASPSLSSTGFRIGLDAVLPTQGRLTGASWTPVARVIWHPSNTVVTSLGTTRGQSTEWSVGVRIKPPAMMRPSAYALASTAAGLRHDTSWSAELGYRSTSGSGSSFSWTGAYVILAKTF